MLHPVGLADRDEPHDPWGGGVAVARMLGELDAVIGEDPMNAVRHGL